jgi:hypothetical protein
MAGVIDLPADEPEIVEHMIQFMYSGGYTDTKASTTTAKTSSEVAFTTTKALVINTKVHIISEKYIIPNLKELATKKFETALVDEWNSESFAAAYV